jgi:hypothetical protein
MIARRIIEGFNRYGFRLAVVDGRLQTTPKPLPPPETAPPGLCRLARLYKQHREEVIRFLQSEQSEVRKVSNVLRYVESADVSNAADMSEPIPTLPIDLGRIADAIAAHPRSPILGDLALAVFARHAVEAQRTIERLPTAAKVEAFRRCREVENEIVGAINGLNYQSAYNIAATLARLPDELNRFALQ